jgi:hypothetical protein
LGKPKLQETSGPGLSSLSLPLTPTSLGNTRPPAFPPLSGSWLTTESRLRSHPHLNHFEHCALFSSNRSFSPIEDSLHRAHLEPSRGRLLKQPLSAPSNRFCSPVSSEDYTSPHIARRAAGAEQKVLLVPPDCAGRGTPVDTAETSLPAAPRVHPPARTEAQASRSCADHMRSWLLPNSDPKIAAGASFSPSTWEGHTSVLLLDQSLVVVSLFQGVRGPGHSTGCAFGAGERKCGPLASTISLPSWAKSSAPLDSTGASGKAPGTVGHSSVTILTDLTALSNGKGHMLDNHDSASKRRCVRGRQGELCALPLTALAPIGTGSRRTKTVTPHLRDGAGSSDSLGQLDPAADGWAGRRPGEASQK